MKKILFTIITLIMLCITVSCNTSKNTSSNTYKVSVSHVFTMSTDTFNINQLDSMINVDTLPVYDKWTKTYLKDGSTNEAYEYATLYDLYTGIIYTVKVLRFDNPVKYIVMKRQTSIKE